MKTSPQTELLDAALAKAQGELENPTKEAINPHFRSKYATLDAGLNIARACLSKHGIALSQPTRLEDGILMLDTRLAHQGQWIESEYPVCAFPIKQQEMGSALTYARRYSLFSLIGIAGEEDDDANSAKSETPAPRRAPSPPKPVAPKGDYLDQEGSQIARDVMIEAVAMAENMDDLIQWYADNAVQITRLLEADKASVRDAYGDRLQSLKGKVAA